MNLFPHCQRWDNKRSSFRPAGETIDTSRYLVEVIDQKTAKRFVTQHHYSDGFPAARLSVGLFRKSPFEKEKLVGCAVFGVPMNNHAIPKYCGLEPNQGVELSRFALRNSEPGNCETYLLGRAMRLLKQAKPEVKSVLSYSDPLPRYAADGTLTKRGHIGIIYRAFGGRYLGRSKKRTLLLDRNGQVISDRTLSKVRNQEVGFDYAEKLLYEAGADWRPFYEHPRDWVNRVVNGPDSPFTKIKHPGNLAYVWAVGSRLDRRHTRRGFAPALPFPDASFLTMT